jgi:tetratricopeptide (TPR) repeat protein
MDALNDKNYPRAEELAGQAIAALPNHPLAYYVRGQAAGARSRWDEAAASFAKAAELYPGSFAAQRDLAASLERLGRVKDAARAYEAALALRDQEELRARMALMLADNGEEPRAMSELEKLTARDSTIPVVWSTLARLSYETGDWAASEKAYAKAVALKDDGRNWFNLGVVRVRLNDLPGALQAFEHAAQTPDVRKQAETEAGRVREAMNPSTGTSRQVRTPGQYSVPTGPPVR